MSINKPRAILISEGIPRVFDATALSNMKLVDVARALDTLTARDKIDTKMLQQLLTRVLAAVSTSALGIMGRPEQLRLIRHLNSALDRIVQRMSLGESLAPVDVRSGPRDAEIERRINDILRLL